MSMKALSIATALLLCLSGCGAAPVASGAYMAEVESVEAFKAISDMTNLRDIAEKILKTQTPAKANKSNVNRMARVMEQVQELAESQKNAKALKIATKCLETYSEMCKPYNDGSLPGDVAQDMKENFLSAFKAILDLYKR